MSSRSDTERVTHALKLEELALMKATEEVNKESLRVENQTIRDFRARGIIQSGAFGGRIAEIRLDRAKQVIDKQIELRRITLSSAPELAREEEFKKLLDSACLTIDRMQASLPQILKRCGLQVCIDAVHQANGLEAQKLKDHARREIEILKREHALQIIRKAEGMVTATATDRRKVWVVHGRNLKAHDAMFAFLRAIGLEPMEWGDALALTGKGTPYTGEVLDQAFAEAQAVIVLITGDDLARLGTRYAESHDPPDETVPTPQARPNVLFEAGMAFGKYPNRTLLVHFGRTRPFSDVIGRNVLYISNDFAKRQGLADRLRTVGCEVKTENRTNWHNAGDFDAANEFPDALSGGDYSDADVAAFDRIRVSLKENQDNHYRPEIGSPEDEQAQRLVARGLLKPGPLGGYMIARYF